VAYLRNKLTQLEAERDQFMDITYRQVIVIEQCVAERDKYRQGCKDRDVVLDEVVVLLNHCRAMEDGPYPEEVSEILSRRPAKGEIT